MSVDIGRNRPQLRAVGNRRRRIAGVRNPVWEDISEGLRRHHLWLNLGWNDIRSRYRRTVIGPFWTVLSTATLVGALGFVNSTLWHTPISSYLPFFCAGYISWLLFVTILTESGSSIIAAEATIKAIRVPYSVFVLRVLTRNLIVFGHNLLVFIVVALIFRVKLTIGTLFLPIGLALAVLNYLWISLILAVICARFRDVIQLIANLSTVLFFITPIFWKPSQLASVPAARFVLADANFAYHLVDVIRSPLLGQTPSRVSFIFLGAAIICGFALTSLFLRRFYRRIAYWL
ncbi:MAG TPA: ABC transporter permease [Stellaceae bacterium]|nr:ABC transporter permease [Stellaceae bacterium]